MKTTIDLPDYLVVAAKKRGAEERRSLRDLVAASLRAHLSAPRGAGTIRWVTVDGGLPEDVDVSNREGMHDGLRRRP